MKTEQEVAHSPPDAGEERHPNLARLYSMQEKERELRRQERERSAAIFQVPRSLQGRFPSGVSGNPGGKKDAAALSKAIRALTANGLELVVHALGVLRAEPKILLDGDGEPVFKLNGDPAIEPMPDHKDRAEARRWLAERGFGKEPIILETREGNTSDIEDLTQVNPDDLRSYLDVRRRFAARAATAPVDAEFSEAHGNTDSGTRETMGPAQSGAAQKPNGT